MNRSHSLRRSFVRLLFPVVASLALLANTAPQTPSELYGDLFVRVQEGRIFGDNKTFVDAVPTRPADAIMAEYRSDPPKTEQQLRTFVLANFSVPGVNAVAPLRNHIRNLWPQLVRQPEAATPGGSHIPLPEPYVVPGGRFREIYYWDSFFTMLGLKADGQTGLIDSMVVDFVSLIERFGHIPNGTRTYYVSRSQPPFFALMLDIAPGGTPAERDRRLAALRAEYSFWMQGAQCATKSRPCDNVVVMPDGSLLNRYWDDRNSPRDESFAEDRATAAEASNQPAAETYRDLRAGAESGWDFSSRWFEDGMKLSTIRTTDIVPIDLNALMFAMEQRIASGCRAQMDEACTRRFSRLAQQRKNAVDKYLWSAAEGRYADWDRISRRQTATLSAATLYPLFVGMSSQTQADAVARLTEDRLLAPGGLRTTLIRTGQQWDAPNGWAPLQWIAVDGLERYGHPDIARAIAGRWLQTVDRTYRETGKMLEKYDVEEQKPGGGGEYPTQDGFGWTNGVASVLLQRYPDLETRATEAVSR